MKNHIRHFHGEHPHGEQGFHRRHEGEGQGHEGQGHEESERHHGRGGHGGQRGGGPGRGHFGGPHFGGPSFEGEGRGGEGRGGEGRGGEGRGGRARRGEARYILLDALRDGPKHGYEIIKSLEERSGGRYSPSPGTVYPTMQLLEDQGLVRADKEAERRVFHLTDAGLADLETHTQEIAAFWERFSSAPSTAQPEAGFVREELESLTRTIWEGLRGSLGSGDPDTLRSVRAVLERSRSEIRAIIAGNKSR